MPLRLADWCEWMGRQMWLSMDCPSESTSLKRKSLCQGKAKNCSFPPTFLDRMELALSSPAYCPGQCSQPFNDTLAMGKF